MMFSWMLFIAIWAVTKHSSCVSIVGLDVPTVALVGDEVHLRCDYRDDDDGSNLYTLKWYKDGKEFYRHQPGISPLTAHDRCADEPIYTVAGVEVDCLASTDRDVVLRSVSRATSGDYRCEVIGEPKFRKQVRNARLTVFSEELQAPSVTGYKHSYMVLEFVSLNCSSNNIEYNPVITWKVNGYPASLENLLKSSDRRTLGLTFQAKVDLFRRGVIDVTCETSLGTSHIRSKRIQLADKDYLSAQEYYYNSGVMRTVSPWNSLLSCLLLMLLSVSVVFPSM